MNFDIHDGWESGRVNRRRCVRGLSLEKHYEMLALQISFTHQMAMSHDVNNELHIAFAFRITSIACVWFAYKRYKNTLDEYHMVNTLKIKKTILVW